MNLFKDYNSIPNFLLRKTVLKFGRLHIRVHDILSEDKTPFLHNHPFYYFSIILKGGYKEELLVDDRIVRNDFKVGSFIWRTPKDFHKIKEINGNTKTLFISWKSNIKWSLKKHDDIWDKDFTPPSKSGLYIRNIKGRDLFCKFDEFWYIGNESKEVALNEKRLSIHQTIKER